MLKNLGIKSSPLIKEEIILKNTSNIPTADFFIDHLPNRLNLDDVLNYVWYQEKNNNFGEVATIFLKEIVLTKFSDNIEEASS